MPDCKHELLRHDHLQVNTENPEAPVFDVVRCRQCNQFLAAFLVEVQHGTLAAILGKLQEIQKTLASVDKSLKQGTKKTPRR